MINKNYMGHDLINFDLENIYCQKYKCNRCNLLIKYYYKDKNNIVLYIHYIGSIDDINWSTVKLTCDEVIIKNIIE